MAYTSDGFRTPFNKFFTILRDKAIISKKDYHFFDETLSNVSNDIAEIDTNVTALDTRVTDLENATPVVANYKMVFKISQSGASAPSLQVIENSFPSDVVLEANAYGVPGDYTIRLNSTVKSWQSFNTIVYFNSNTGGVFNPTANSTVNQDQLFIIHNGTGSGPNFYTNFRIKTYSGATAALANGIMYEHSITILVTA